MRFEWDNAKAHANLRIHGVAFEQAKAVFNDPFAVEWLDDREDYGEQWFVTIGGVAGQLLLFVAWAEREDCIRIISARKATQNEQIEYFRQNF